MRVGVVGYGMVGKSLVSLLQRGSIPSVVYDEYKSCPPSNATREEINQCDLVFVSVPTPALDSGECDLSAVENVVHWISPPICIKSTIVPGTVDRLTTQTGKKIVFGPEYIGETPFHEYRNLDLPDLVVVGGDTATAEQFLRLYRMVLGPTPHYFNTDAVTAELSKYMENCFFATKVAFVAQFYTLATQFGVDFTELREIWVADRRVGRSHSTVVDKPGFGGRCLPKDLSAIINSATQRGEKPAFLIAVQAFNNMLRTSD